VILSTKFWLVIKPNNRGWIIVRCSHVTLELLYIKYLHAFIPVIYNLRALWNHREAWFLIHCTVCKTQEPRPWKTQRQYSRGVRRESSLSVSLWSSSRMIILYGTRIRGEDARWKYWHILHENVWEVSNVRALASAVRKPADGSELQNTSLSDTMNCKAALISLAYVSVTQEVKV
jgi:hypothetical protein